MPLNTCVTKTASMLALMNSDVNSDHYQYSNVTYNDLITRFSDLI